MSISDKLQTLKNTKNAIKQALIDKGVEISDSDNFASYADKIGEIKVGGQSTGTGLSIEDLLMEGTELTEYSNDRITAVCEYAFYKRTSIQSYNLPNVINIGNNAFSQNNIISISLLNAINIGDYAFYYCPNLETINIPKAETIGVNCFQRTALVNVILPSAKSLAPLAFQLCSKLVSLDLPSLCEPLYNNTFTNCSSLRKIWIPSTCQKIYASQNTTDRNHGYPYSPFYNCSADLVIYTDAPSRPTEWYGSCFRYDSENDVTVIYGATHEEFLAAQV